MGRPAPPSADDPQELHRLFAERASAGDLEGLMVLYEDRATFVAPGADHAAGAGAIRERLQSLLAASPQITPLDGRTVVAGDIALMSYRWRISFGASEGGFESQSAEVARRQDDGSWRYVIDDPGSATIISDDDASAALDRVAFEQLIYAEEGPVARITLNRPARRNALSMQLSDELTRVLELVRESRTLKVLVLAGAGESFCSGDDITEMALWGNANEIVRRVRSYQRMADTLADLDKVTIAAVDGYAVGGGLEITMACDFVIATARAKWGMPEIDVGITPGWGGTTRMARLIGRRMTKEVNLLGALHPASRAAALGLWNRVVADDALQTEVDALIEVLLSKNQQALRQLKLIIDKGVEADLHTAQGFEALSAGLSGAVNGAWQIEDADQAAGIAGFIGKGERWQDRRELAREFWSDGPTAAERPG